MGTNLLDAAWRRGGEREVSDEDGKAVFVGEQVVGPTENHRVATATAAVATAVVTAAVATVLHLGSSVDPQVATVRVEPVSVATSAPVDDDVKHDEPDPWGMENHDGLDMPPLEEPEYADDAKTAEPVVPQMDVPEPLVAAVPLLYHMPQTSPRGITAFLMANAPKAAPVLEEVDAFSRSEAEDVIDDMAARNNCSFTVQANMARLALISLADAKIAKLKDEIEAIERDVRNARALVPLTLLVNRLRQTATSKRSKQQLAVQATSCRQQEAKRARLL